MYCPNCGCTNDDESTVCNNCGVSLEKEKSTPPLSSKKITIIILVIVLIFVSIVAAGTIAKTVRKRPVNNVHYSENTELSDEMTSNETTESMEIPTNTAKENNTINNAVTTTKKETTTAQSTTAVETTTTQKSSTKTTTKKAATTKKATTTKKTTTKKAAATKKSTTTTKKSTQTQYRYRDKKFTTSTSNQMSGWTLYNTTTAWSNYGAWSNWSTSYYSSSSFRQVENRVTYRYCAFKCTNCGNRDPYSTPCDNCKTSKYFRWEETWITTKGNNMNKYTMSTVPDKYYVTINGQRWWFERDGYSDGQGGIGQPSRTEYRYRDRKQVTTYYFYKWSNWSEWSTTPVSSSDTREVETRKV